MVATSKQDMPPGLRKINDWLSQYEHTKTEFVEEVNLWNVKLTNTFAKKFTPLDWPNLAKQFPPEHYLKGQVRREVIAIAGAFYARKIIVDIDEINKVLNQEPFHNSDKEYAPLTEPEFDILQAGLVSWRKKFPQLLSPIDIVKPSAREVKKASELTNNFLLIYIQSKPKLFILFLIAAFFITIYIFTMSNQNLEAVSPIALPLNNQWQVKLQTFDGIDMVLVPIKCFMMGREAGPDREHPVHQQCIKKAFWIDRTDITNAQYRSVATATDNCNPSFGSVDPDWPRICINWIMATNFCKSRGERLPTEAEWEWAARGPDESIYPWGNNFDSDKALTLSSGIKSKRVAKVGSYPSGTSWVGALDMSGELWQWTSSLYKMYPYNSDDGRENQNDMTTNRVLRGGSWDNEDWKATTTYRGNSDPHIDFNSFGFRCVRDY